LKTIETILKRLARLAAFLAVATIVGLMLLTVVTVVFRAVGIAFPGTYSLSELLLIPAISFSLAYAAWEGEHTRVTLLVERFKSRRVRDWLHGAMTGLGLLFWAGIAWAAIRETLRRQAQNELSPILNVPVAPFRWLMVSAFVLLCAILAFQAVRLFLGRDAGAGSSETGAPR